MTGPGSTTLTIDQALDLTVEVIASIAPDIADELPTLDRTIDLWEELQLDSMDHLNVMSELGDRTGVTIAERDYAGLRSLAAIADHLASATR